jgi:nitroreductase
MAAVAAPTDLFPYRGTLRERLRHVLQYAILAPSTHNTQPWTFTLDDDLIEVYLDRSRNLTHVDPDGREMAMSVGAAIEHLRLAMVCHLMEPEIQLLPDFSGQDLVARVKCQRDAAPTPADLRAFSQVGRRHTVRGEFERRAIPADQLDAIRHSSIDTNAGVLVVDEGTLRERIVQMVKLGDEALLSEESFRREVGSWIHHGQRNEGLPAGTLGIDPIRAALAPFFVGSFDVGAAKAVVDEAQIKQAPAVAIVCTRGDHVLDWLYAGMAIARLALNASAHGVRCSYYLQPIQIPAFRRELKAATQALGYPQILLRLGYAEEGEPTPRRPLEDVLVERRRRSEEIR